ncbi:MAG: hypothetical protein N2049_04515 [Anaerolineales bacterium]|nr:hypothetical protein [Anaerolineales bacterium]MCX7608466.1 hypothetical protein [Anaerolineales bacterium]MDW8227594.1 hypothetical protein [Anaerolineales bacterium]
MKQDRFLIGILIFIGTLVIAALALFFVQKEIRDYRPGSEPADVVYNYALAIQKGDFERAYSYLADGKNKPSYEYFLQNFRYATLDAALEIQSTRVEGKEAWVDVMLHYAGSGPFDSGWSSPDAARLVRQQGEWKLLYVPAPYWGWDWFQPTPEPVGP